MLAIVKPAGVATVAADPEGVFKAAVLHATMPGL
jgi:hypothetical protein